MRVLPRAHGRFRRPARREDLRGQRGGLRAPQHAEQFWDGRAATLEAQAVLPFINPIEMGIEDHPALERLVAGLPDYPPLFQAAFGSDAVTVERIGKALASFERTLISVSAPIDRFLKGDPGAISDSAKRGWELFNAKARCNTCHGWVEAFPLFTDELYHNIGVAAKGRDFTSLSRRAQGAATSPEAFEKLAFDPDATELGRFIVTREPKDIGAFKTPQLRNVALTAPYMHDGSEATLLAVIEFYDRGGENNPFLDGGMRPLGLTPQERADLVELMKTFTSDDLDRFADLERLMPK
jgi:cytochrome c peroxidase